MKKTFALLALLAAGTLSAHAAYTVTTDNEMYTNPAAWLYVWTGGADSTNWDTSGNWDCYKATDDSAADASGKPVSSDPAFIGYDFAMVDGKQVLTANDSTLTVTMAAWPSKYIYLGSYVTLTGSNNGFDAGTNIDFADFSGTSTISMGSFWKRGDVNITGALTMQTASFSYDLFTSSDLQQDAGTWNGSGIAVTDALGNTLTYSTTVTDEVGFYYIEKTVVDGVSTITLHANGAIPEPATATLSLLALAGLAARRRRK